MSMKRRRNQERTDRHPNRFATGPIGQLLNYTPLANGVEHELDALRALPSLDLPNYASKGFSGSRSNWIEPGSVFCSKLNKSRPPERTKYKTPYGVYGQFSDPASEYQDKFVYGPEFRRMQPTIAKKGEYTYVFDNTTLRDFDVEALRQKRILSPISPLSALSDAVAAYKKPSAAANRSKTVEPTLPMPPLSPPIQPIQSSVRNQEKTVPQRQHHLSRRLKNTIMETYVKHSGKLDESQPLPLSYLMKGVAPASPSLEEINAMNERLTNLREEIRLINLEDQVHKLL